MDPKKYREGEKLAREIPLSFRQAVVIEREKPGCAQLDVISAHTCFCAAESEFARRPQAEVPALVQLIVKQTLPHVDERLRGKYVSLIMRLLEERAKSVAA